MSIDDKYSDKQDDSPTFTGLRKTPQGIAEKLERGNARSRFSTALRKGGNRADLVLKKFD